MAVRAIMGAVVKVLHDGGLVADEVPLLEDHCLVHCRQFYVEFFVVGGGDSEVVLVDFDAGGGNDGDTSMGITGGGVAQKIVHSYWCLA
ncbi:Hypothetical predicted protein [Olea europaea subsp. europaea]|uniref:Uncharacterized protein n=1 Tax=Olea europaea subsp. europaea TaxID=158383 RepID=A0A8S0PRP9_OLEEU|nr:Hypothetical predicted protein [Olea europaea subsp. europaea]